VTTATDIILSFNNALP